MPRLANLSDPIPEIYNPAGVSWWSEFQPGWLQQVTTRAVDKDRTAALANITQDVRCRTSSLSVPLQLCDGIKPTKVYEATAKPSWTNPFPSRQVPLPGVVRILRNTDDQWFGIDWVTGIYWECSAIGPTLFGFPAPWRADTIRSWDLRRDWRLQPRGMTGAGVPLWPMVPRPDDLLNGNVNHALHFVATGYSPDAPVGFATKTDGVTFGHPLRSGERLRLRKDRVPTVRNVAEAAVVGAMLVHGIVLTDRTDGPSHNVRLPLDPRLDVDLDLAITDFEVLQP